jgi:queuine/archaeosine tRNA-ribosyltransferase
MQSIRDAIEEERFEAFRTALTKKRAQANSLLKLGV